MELFLKLIPATETQCNMQPIISICVPTFNRAVCLENLINNLAILRTRHGFEIEICISDNHSTDATSQVIEKWGPRLKFNAVCQTENIGATMNAIAVVELATGKWIMVIGDDDELIIDNFSKLLASLKSAHYDDWILVGVADAAGKEFLLGQLAPGRYEAKSFRRILLRTGLYRFGFIGMHVFPSMRQSDFVHLLPNQTKPWPHLALLLQHLQGGHFQVLSVPIVEQAAGGSELFWNLGNWVRISLRKMQVIAGVAAMVKEHQSFLNMLILRELFSLRNAKELVLWKALEPRDFCHSALQEHIDCYMLLGFYSSLATIHCMFILLLYVTPSIFIRVILRLIGKKQLIQTYNLEKNTKNHFEGFNRGI